VGADRDRLVRPEDPGLPVKGARRAEKLASQRRRMPVNGIALKRLLVERAAREQASRARKDAGGAR
jgi:hypothetical protein